MQAAEIIIATGSAPRSIPGIEVDGKRIITSDEAIHLSEIPKSLVILGSGAVGVEFASIFRRFGSEVTIVELLPRIVPSEDETISAELEKSFRKQGIKVLTGTRVTKAAATSTGSRDSGDGIGRQGARSDRRRSACCNRTRSRYDGARRRGGRHPDGEGVHQGGFDVSHIGAERLSDRRRDCSRWRIPHPQLAHVSSAEGIVVAERLAGKDVQPLNYDHVPSCTYCDPEIGSVGLTEAEARTRGYTVRVGSFPFGVLGRAKMAGETEGLVKIVADTQYDEVLGVHMIGSRSTELVAEAVLALRLECTVEELIRTIHAHPTFSEAVGEAAHATHGAAIHL